MIKILQVVSSLNINAGMMSVMMNYYRHINKDEIQFDFLYLYKMEDSHEEEIKSLGGKAFYLGEPGFNSEYKQKLAKFFDEHKGEYTAVHCHPIWTPALVGFEAKKAGVPHIIAHSHSTKYSEKKVSAIRNRLMMPIIKSVATDYVACSDDAAHLFGKSEKFLKKVFVLHNAINLEKFFFDAEERKRIRSEFNIGEKEKVICHVGRFSVEKNHEFLINLFAHINKEHPDTKLLLAGDGALRERMQTLAKELGLEKEVVFTGKRQDISAILSASDVFILPSLFEGVPVSVVEAQASGLPCVLSGSITRQVNMGNCSYVDLNAPACEWTAAIMKNTSCQNGSLDGFRLSSGNKLLTSSYDIKAETQRLERFYLDLSE